MAAMKFDGRRLLKEIVVTGEVTPPFGFFGWRLIVGGLVLRLACRIVGLQYELKGPDDVDPR